MYNLVLLCPDDLPKDVARQASSVGEMRKLFTSWDPILTRFLDHVDTVDKWKLMYRSPLESWINEGGTFVLIGDSCHPMLPYLAQGANSSIEDGGVLGRLLECMDSKDHLRHRIKLYEQLRKIRSEAIVRETFHQRDAFHMPDGPEQEERDKLFASQLGKRLPASFQADGLVGKSSRGSMVMTPTRKLMRLWLPDLPALHRKSGCDAPTVLLMYGSVYSCGLREKIRPSVAMRVSVAVDSYVPELKDCLQERSGMGQACSTWAQVIQDFTLRCILLPGGLHTSIFAKL
jgi:hypothetical protein